MTFQEVKKITQLYDEGDQTWRDVYAAPGIAGPITAEVPREDQEPKAVRRHLLRKGAALPPAAENRASLDAAIAAEAPVVHRAARTGWREDNRLFVSHLHVAGEPTNGVVIPPTLAVSGSAGQLGMHGDLESWQELVRVARHSTAMIIALCTAFAAPLLSLVRRPSFALVLFGPSRCGKSTAQLVGASVLGFGEEEHLPSLNATPAGLLATALAFNDHMVPINEIGTARRPKREVYIALRDATYALMSGQDVLRHPSWTGGGNGMPSTFQVIPLLSSEHSPDAWAARNGETRDEGETARLIGVPVIYGARGTIFDRPPKGLVGEALDAWESSQFGRLRQGLPKHRCFAFQCYLDALVRDQEALGIRARNLVLYFEKQVGQPSMSPVARDIVAKFGVEFAGGMIAIRTGILPLDRVQPPERARRHSRSTKIAFRSHFYKRKCS